MIFLQEVNPNGLGFLTLHPRGIGPLVLEQVIHYGKIRKKGIMKIIRLLMLSIFMLSFLFGCNALFSDERLSFDRIDYEGHELRLDGYYYRQGKDYTLVYFFYKNGIVLSANSYRNLDLNIVEDQLLKRYSQIVKEKPNWGIFKIASNQIEYEQWEAPTEGGLSISHSKGYIENDTTFHIIETYFSYNKKTYFDHEVWHFKQFAHKPDSTNSFIN
jgi:hypothetical protein